MSMFWIIGIIANVIFLALAMYWIVKEWRKNDSRHKPRNSDSNR